MRWGLRLDDAVSTTKAQFMPRGSPASWGFPLNEPVNSLLCFQAIFEFSFLYVNDPE